MGYRGWDGVVGKGKGVKVRVDNLGPAPCRGTGPVVCQWGAGWAGGGGGRREVAGGLFVEGEGGWPGGSGKGWQLAAKPKVGWRKIRLAP